MHTFVKGEPLSKLFPVNTIIWRGKARFYDSGADGIEPFDFNECKGVKGRDLMMRVRYNAEFLWEPSAVEGKFSGIICFVQGEPDPDWTHLLVTGSKDTERGGCLFAKFAKPYKMEDYVAFRDAMFHKVRQNLNAPYEDQLKLAVSIQPSECRPDERRLFCRIGLTGIDFNFIRQQEKP